MTFSGGWSLSSRARVLLADDNAMVAAEMRELLEPSLEVIGVVNSGEALVAAFDLLGPDVVVADITMPGEGGLAAVRHIRERCPDTPVVLLTVDDASPMIRRGFSAGAQGYVVKEDAGDELVRAVEAALEGRRYVSATALRSLL